MASTSTLINRLENTVDKFSGEIQVAVGKVEDSITDITDTSQKIYQKVDEFKKVMIAGEEKQLAYENILKIDQKINEKLSSYQTIRKSVIGVIKDCDINLVRNATVQELSEELWMNNSRYWLSYALIAISAWVQDNREIADNAIVEAIRKDAVKSSLFFCLLAIRFSRNECAKKWLVEYFRYTDPKKPSQEAGFLLQAFLYGAFGNDKLLEAEVRKTVEAWVAELKTNNEISSDLSSSYYNYIDKMYAKSDADFSVLSSYSSDYDKLKAAIDDTAKFDLMIKNIEEVDIEEVKQTDKNFTARLDKLLDNLVNEYDDEEVQLKNEQRYYQIIMQCEGDVEKAKELFEEYNKNNPEGANIGKKMLNWALYEESSKHVKKFAIQKTKDWYIGAVESYAASLKAKKPEKADLKIDLWSGSTTGHDRDAVVEQLNSTFQSKKIQMFVFNKVNIIMLVVAILAGVISAAVAIGANLPLAWLGYIITGGLIIAMLVSTMLTIKKFPQRIENAKKILYLCVDEMHQYSIKYDEFEKQKSILLDKLYLI